MSEEIKNIIAEVELTLDITVKPMVLFQRQHIKQLLDLITNLQTQLQQKENIIKEVRECINKKLNINSGYVDYDFGTELLRQELLEILDKAEQ